MRADGRVAIFNCDAHTTPLRHRFAMPPLPKERPEESLKCTSQQILDTNHKKIYNKNYLLVRYPFVMQLAILSWRQIV